MTWKMLLKFDPDLKTFSEKDEDFKKYRRYKRFKELMQ